MSTFVNSPAPQTVHELPIDDASLDSGFLARTAPEAGRATVNSLSEPNAAGSTIGGTLITASQGNPERGFPGEVRSIPIDVGTAVAAPDTTTTTTTTDPSATTPATPGSTVDPTTQALIDAIDGGGTSGLNSPLAGIQTATQGALEDATPIATPTTSTGNTALIFVIGGIVVVVIIWIVVARSKKKGAQPTPPAKA